MIIIYLLMGYTIWHLIGFYAISKTNIQFSNMISGMCGITIWPIVLIQYWRGKL